MSCPPRMIDLNADLGEGAGDDEAMLEVVTSASIACGGHAGDAATAERVCRLAAARGVRVGAHPGYADRAGFGRVELGEPAEQIATSIARQLRLLRSAAGRAGAPVAFVKPHGALYHRLASDDALARRVAPTLADALPGAAWLAAPGAALLRLARAHAATPVAEAFADRRYVAGPGGRPGLLPRTEPGAVLDADDAAAQARQFALSGTVTAAGGEQLQLGAASICLHGDTPGAVGLARAVRRELEAAGITIAPFRA